MPIARWTLLSRGSALQRSSHCLAVTSNGRAIIYGGELKPRTPVDAGDLKGSVHAFNIHKPALQDGWVRKSVDITTSRIPEPRVGAAASILGEDLYVWGGRGGADMAPLPSTEAGMWHCSLEDPTQISWNRIEAENENDAPQSRSYHAIAAHEVGQSTIRSYVHSADLPRIRSIYMLDAQQRAGLMSCTHLMSRQDDGRPYLLDQNLVVEVLFSPLQP